MAEMQTTPIVKPLPKTGLSAADIRAFLDEREVPAPHGHFSRAFRPPKDVEDLAKEAYLRFMSDNGFFSLYLPYMQTVEQEVIAMGVSLLNPEPDSTGNFVSGGTEANFSGLHAAKEWARVHRPNAKAPKVVAPHTIHPSFQKAAQYLDMEIVTTELDENGRGVAENIRAAIDADTVMVAASAPSWHFSRIDPIPEIAAVAQEAGLWMHVDACVGGYISPFLEKLGHTLTPWDFRVPGVMSISADLHKYGYCPKPASTIFFRHADLQRYHYVGINDHYLGPYKMTGLAGSRSAGPIFAAWTVMSYLGEEGYLRLTRQVLAHKERFTRLLSEIEGIEVWDVDVMPLHFSSSKAPIESIYQGLLERGWIALGLFNPGAVSIPIDPSLTDAMADAFIADVRTVTEALLAGGGPEKGTIRYG